MITIVSWSRREQVGLRTSSIFPTAQWYKMVHCYVSELNQSLMMLWIVMWENLLTSSQLMSLIMTKEKLRLTLQCIHGIYKTRVFGGETIQRVIYLRMSLSWATQQRCQASQVSSAWSVMDCTSIHRRHCLIQWLQNYGF